MAIFNDEQVYGPEYQLMKAMVRKITERFDESDLIPEFMCGKLNDIQLLNRFENNTVGLTKVNKHAIKGLAIR